jgi:hypothetical protein
LLCDPGVRRAAIRHALVESRARVRRASPRLRIQAQGLKGPPELINRQCHLPYAQALSSLTPARHQRERGCLALSHPMAFAFDDSVHLLRRESDRDIPRASSHPTGGSGGPDGRDVRKSRRCQWEPSAIGWGGGLRVCVFVEESSPPHTLTHAVPPVRLSLSEASFNL